MDCSQILKFGIFDISKSSSEEDLATSFVRWLTSREVRTAQEASEVSVDIGIPLPELPVPLDFGGGSSSSSSGSYGKALAEFFQTNTNARRKFSQEFNTANPGIVEAWKECSRNCVGLIGWAEQTEKPDEILLRLEVRPKVYPYNGLTITEVVTSSNVKSKSKLEGRKMADQTSEIFVRIGDDQDEAVNFVVRTNDLNYETSFKVSGFSRPINIFQQDNGARHMILSAEKHCDSILTTGADSVHRFKLSVTGVRPTDIGNLRIEAASQKGDGRITGAQTLPLNGKESPEIYIDLINHARLVFNVINAKGMSKDIVLAEFFDPNPKDCLNHEFRFKCTITVTLGH